MAVHDVSTGSPVSMNDGREEALKSSPHSPNYPTPGRQMVNMRLFGHPDYNYNGHPCSEFIGGGLPVSLLYGYNTYKPPIIQGGWVDQYYVDEDVRVYITLSEGDVFRTGFIVQRADNLAFTTNVQTYGVYRTGPEHPDYANSSAIKARKNSQNPDEWEDNSNSSSTYYPDNEFGTEWPTMIQIQIKVDLAGSPSGVTTYWRIRMVDGRLLDTLAAQTSASYIVNTGSIGSYPSTEWYDLEPFTAGTEFYNQHTGDGGIKIFSTWGNWNFTNGITEVTLTPDNIYHYFIDGNDPQVWVRLVQGDYVADGEPLGPSTDPADWELYTGPIVSITGLTENTDYYMWIADYETGDSANGYPQGSNVSNQPDFDWTTESTPALETPANVTVSNVDTSTPNAITFDVSWTHSEGTNGKYSIYISINDASFIVHPDHEAKLYLNNLEDTVTVDGTHFLYQDGDRVEVGITYIDSNDDESALTTAVVQA